MPFEEIPHTADWSLRVWADDLPHIFSEAARGMYALAGTRSAAGPTVERRLQLSAPDSESLLVNFLSELLFISEQERLAFREYSITIHGERLDAQMTGTPILSIDKAIKAVTYHNLHITYTSFGYETEIVFDV